jgi:RND family efflux transporter MFP subunit
MMQNYSKQRDLASEDPAAPPVDEGGLHAPPGLSGWRKAWWWFDFIILVKLARLRFIGILALIGVIITQWDALLAYWDRFTRPADAAVVTTSDVEWFCPMHPTVVRDNGKEKCPVCFMPLSKRKKGDVHAEALPPGVVSRVQLSPYRVVLAGVQLWSIDYIALSKQISAVGFIEFNERDQRQVSAWVGGRLDKLYVNETGQMVETGDVLAELYSPDLYSGTRELLIAARGNSKQLAASSRERLRLLGISEDQLDELLKIGKANTHLKITSPIGGHVIKKYVIEGEYVEQGAPLYDLADLSTVWVEAQIYEDDFPFLPRRPMLSGDASASAADAASLAVTVASRAFPDEPFEGKLSFIHPHVDEATRTVTIRCEVANPGHKLLPGTTVTMTLHVPPEALESLVRAAAGDPERQEKLQAGLVLAVPESAVIDTGSQHVVYRESQPNVFDGVQVELGPRMTGPDGGTFYPLLSGLTAGERVVAAGSFLIDAETRLNPAAGSIYFGGSGGSQSSESNVTRVRPSTPEDPDAKLAAALASLSSEDRTLAEAQKFCPILKKNRLGSMGPPVKLEIAGKTVFVCCKGCKEPALEEPDETLAQVSQFLDAKNAAEPGDSKRQMPAEKPGRKKTRAERIKAALAKLSPADRKLAEQQRYCPILPDIPLGSMGTPLKLTLDGKTVFLCCPACKPDAETEPVETARAANELRQERATRAKH